MNKEFFKKFHNSLAFTMGFHSMYVPCFTFAHQMRDYGLGVMLLSATICFIVFSYFISYLLYKLIGDIGFKDVNEDRRLRGFFSLFIISMLVMAPYMLFFEEKEPLIRWSAWLLMVIFLFFVAYSICKQYIMKRD